MIQNQSWQLLRGLRANPPGKAASDPDRRAVFTAALEQSEQLLTAGAAVGFATKPLQLFYALSQAGRAIAAAHAGDPWEITGHGASVNERTPIETTAVSTHAKPDGAVRLVAETTGTELWDGEATLEQLWASLPELREWPLSQRPQPLALEPDTFWGTDPEYVTLARPAGPVIGGRHGKGAVVTPKYYSVQEEEAEAVLTELLAPYPRAAGWQLTTGMVTTQAPPRTWLWWPRKDAEGRVVLTAIESLTDFYGDTYYLRPGVGENDAVPSPLVTWWGILLALSTLTRYEPVAWRAALDIDASRQGHALEQGLLLAGERIPELVLEAVTGV